jgi:cytochrome c biogenesis protein CcmG, thiol:disulfide interchange protein DsbE
LRRFAAVLLLLFAACATPAPSQPGGIEEGTPSIFEEALADLRGKPVVVNWWATWCKPCTAEMPRIVDAAKEYKDRVAFLGVDVEDDTELAAEFAKDYGMTFRSIADPDGKIRKAESILGLPVTQFYDADGELVFNHQGEIKEDDLEEKIEEVLDLSRS